MCPSLIGAVTLVLLPLTFLSSALMQQDLAPDWIGTVAKFNPVNWAVEAGRSAAMEQIDWGLVASRLGLLFALIMATGFGELKIFAGSAHPELTREIASVLGVQTGQA